MLQVTVYLSRNGYVLLLVVPYFKLLFADLPTRRPAFSPRLFSLGIVLDKVALIQGALQVLQFLQSLFFHECFIQTLSFITTQGILLS